MAYLCKIIHYFKQTRFSCSEKLHPNEKSCSDLHGNSVVKMNTLNLVYIPGEEHENNFIFSPHHITYMNVIGIVHAADFEIFTRKLIN